MPDQSTTTSLLSHCLPCGAHCCRYSTPILDRYERDRIVQATGRDYFVEMKTAVGSYFIIGRMVDGSPRRIAPDAGREGDPCSFLSAEGHCSIHDIKPLDCAAYPMRAVPLADGTLSWHLHRGCPAHARLSSTFVKTARELAATSARRFAPKVFADWLQRFSRWTLDPRSLEGGDPALTERQSLPRAVPQEGNSNMHQRPAEIDANVFMRDTVKALAHRQPGLCDRSGRGFWPVPVMFPLLLAHCLHRLQQRVSELYLGGHYCEGELLAACRCNVLRLVAEGDLGEDHASLFLADHHEVRGITGPECRQLPFFAFCEGILRIDDPVVLLGALMRNEAGSLGEMEALLGEGLISSGRFSEVHLVEEVTHARLAEEIAERLATVDELNHSFQIGQALHDQIYASVA